MCSLAGEANGCGCVVIYLSVRVFYQFYISDIFSESVQSAVLLSKCTSHGITVVQCSLY